VRSGDYSGWLEIDYDEKKGKLLNFNSIKFNPISQPTGAKCPEEKPSNEHTSS